MKAARVVVLSVAIGAGGLAAMLAGQSEKPPEVKPEAVQVDTVDVLVAKGDIPMGTALSAGDLQWQAWPATAASGNFIRKNNRPQAVEDLNGPADSTQFTTTEVFRRARPDEPLTWTGQIPVRLSRALAEAGYDIRDLVDAHARTALAGTDRDGTPRNGVQIR